MYYVSDSRFWGTSSILRTTLSLLSRLQRIAQLTPSDQRILHAATLLCILVKSPMSSVYNQRESRVYLQQVPALPSRLGEHLLKIG